MVTIGIMVIINGIIFFNYPKVMANLDLRRTADEIALLARQAQAYAMAAKSEGGELPSYGVHFDTGAPTTIVLFADNDSSNSWNAGDATVQTFDIQTKDEISSLSCGVSCGSTADVVYSRLDPTAKINNNTGISSVGITIESHRDPGSTKIITIYKNGYISIQ